MYHFHTTITHFQCFEQKKTESSMKINGFWSKTLKMCDSCMKMVHFLEKPLKRNDFLEFEGFW